MITPLTREDIHINDIVVDEYGYVGEVLKLNPPDELITNTTLDKDTQNYSALSKCRLATPDEIEKWKECVSKDEELIIVPQPD